MATPAIVLATMRYRESSKIVRLATEAAGVQSVVAKGALRPRSRFGAALQPLSDGLALFHLKNNRDLHTLVAFDTVIVRVGLTANLERYSSATVLAELMLRFAPADPHPESFALLRASLNALEEAPAEVVEVVALRSLWQLVRVLGFAPALDFCAQDGVLVPPHGPITFSLAEGGVLCTRCAGRAPSLQLPARARAQLGSFLSPRVALPDLDPTHARAHRRLFTRYLEHHVAEGRALPALAFWSGRPWVRQ